MRALLLGACSSTTGPTIAYDAGQDGTSTPDAGDDRVAPPPFADGGDGAVAPDVSAHAPYEGCRGSESCANDTACLTAMYTTTGSPGSLCSRTCTSGSECPASAFGSSFLPTCVVSVSAGSGLCYDTCVSNEDCGPGTTCAQLPGTTVRICVPAT